MLFINWEWLGTLWDLLEMLSEDGEEWVHRASLLGFIKHTGRDKSMFTVVSLEKNTMIDK